MVKTEGDLIELFTHIFHSQKDQSQPDFTDDCAYLHKEKLLITTDALCEGIHFDLQWDSLYQVGRQAAIVNLSDLAASGGSALALFWNISAPPTWSTSHYQELAKGFASIAHQYQASVLGGNLCVRSGPLEVTVTALGKVEKNRIHRSGAQVGDWVYLTGSLGRSALGYLDPTPLNRNLRHQWRPHLEEAAFLTQWGQVSAMMDLSDGLALDAQRLAQTSGVQIDLSAHLIPWDSCLSQASPSLKLTPLEIALTGGEDYVLLFTSSQKITPQNPPFNQYTFYPIGQCKQILPNPTLPNSNAHWLTLDQEPLDLNGYDHFTLTHESQRKI